jgi:hypothetical protein
MNRCRGLDAPHSFLVLPDVILMGPLRLYVLYAGELLAARPSLFASPVGPSVWAWISPKDASGEAPAAQGAVLANAWSIAKTTIADSAIDDKVKP